MHIYKDNVMLCVVQRNNKNETHKIGD
jgi:hypothetical protein